MRSAGVHQGLAPVLDVARDPRWGRVEETIGEDPYLVGDTGHGVRARAGVGGRDRDAEALRRLFGLQVRPQHGAGERRPAPVRRRLPAPVRDGTAPRPRPVGDAFLRRRRRRAAGRGPGAADRRAARRTRLRWRGGLRLLRHLVPGNPAQRGRIRGRGGRAGAARRSGRRTAEHALLRRAAGGGRDRRGSARVPRRPGSGPGAAAEVRAGTAGPGRQGSRCPGPAGRAGNGDRPRIRRRIRSWPGAWPSTRSSCWPMAPAPCRWTRRRASPSSARWLPTRWPSSAVTRSRGTSATQTPASARASHCRPC